MQFSVANTRISVLQFDDMRSVGIVFFCHEYLANLRLTNHRYFLFRLYNKMADCLVAHLLVYWNICCFTRTATLSIMLFGNRNLRKIFLPVLRLDFHGDKMYSSICSNTFVKGLATSWKRQQGEAQSLGEYCCKQESYAAKHLLREIRLVLHPVRACKFWGLLHQGDEFHSGVVNQWSVFPKGRIFSSSSFIRSAETLWFFCRACLLHCRFFLQS